MAIQVADNFKYSGKKPLDDRITSNSLTDLLAISGNTVYDGIMVYVKSVQKYYVFDSTRTPDPTLGYWAEFTTSGGAVFDTKSNFPTVGDGGKLYIATDENTIYRFDTSGGNYKSLTGGIGKQYSYQIVGDGHTTQWTINHNLNSKKILCSIFNDTTGDIQIMEQKIIDIDNLQLSCEDALPTATKYNVEIIAW